MKKLFKVCNSLIGLGLLVGLIAMFILIQRVSSIEEKLVFNHYWMMVKKYRADKIEYRLDKLEQALGKEGRSK